MDIENLIKTAKMAKLNKFQLTVMVYKPLLKALGYPVDNTSKMVEGYVLNEIEELIADYAYMKDNSPNIAIFLDDIVDATDVSKNTERCQDVEGLKYILTMSGKVGELYYRNNDNENYQSVVAVDFINQPVTEWRGLSPIYILSRSNSYWDDVLNERLYREIEENKSMLIDEVISSLNASYPRKVNKKNISYVLDILSGRKGVSTKTTKNGRKVYSKLLSEIEYDTDFRYTTIDSVLIGDKEFKSLNYTDLFKELVNYMENFIDESNINKISSVGLYRSTCQMKDRLSSMSASYKNNNVVLGNTYIGLAATGKVLINTAKRLFDVLEINQNNVLIQWVDNTDERDNKATSVKEINQNKRGEATLTTNKPTDGVFMLSDINNTDDFTSTKIKELVVFGEEHKSPSYRELVRITIKWIVDKYSLKFIDDTLSNNHIEKFQIVPNYYELTDVNKKNNEKLGNHYIGLNYSVSDILTGIISLCEVFDIDQDEITIYLEE